jgi:lysozyme
MDTDKAKMELMIDEGSRLVVYDDATGDPIKPGSVVKGHPSIGIGRALDVNGLSQLEVMYLLDNDIARTWRALRQALPWVDALPDAHQRVILNMAFNMGIVGLLGWVHFLDAMRTGDRAKAKQELFDSKWAYQVDDGPGKHIGRADRLAALIDQG